MNEPSVVFIRGGGLGISICVYFRVFVLFPVLVYTSLDVCTLCSGSIVYYWCELAVFSFSIFVLESIQCSWLGCIAVSSLYVCVHACV